MESFCLVKGLIKHSVLARAVRKMDSTCNVVKEIKEQLLQ